MLHAGLFELRYRNCVAAFLCQSHFTLKYNTHLWNTNSDRVTELYKKLQALTEEATQPMLTWSQCTYDDFVDKMAAADIDKQRNLYMRAKERYTDDTRTSKVMDENRERYKITPIILKMIAKRMYAKKKDDLDTVGYGLSYLKAVAGSKDKSYGLNSSTYLAFISICCSVAWKSVELCLLPQAEHCLAAADTCVIMAKEKNWPETSKTSTQLEYAEALINLGYCHLMFSWVDNLYGKVNINFHVDKIPMENIKINAPSYRTPCGNDHDARLYIDEGIRRKEMALKLAELKTEQDFKTCEILEKTAKKGLRQSGNDRRTRESMQDSKRKK